MHLLQAVSDAIVTEMRSSYTDLDYWRRVLSCSPFEIVFIKLFNQGPTSLARHVAEFFASFFVKSRDVAENGHYTFQEEVHHHVAQLRICINDLSCLLACVSDAASLFKRSYLMSNNRKYLYFVCDDKEDSSGVALAPLRQLALGDVRDSLTALIAGFQRFENKRFTPDVQLLFSPRHSMQRVQRVSSGYEMSKGAGAWSESLLNGPQLDKPLVLERSRCAPR